MTLFIFINFLSRWLPNARRTTDVIHDERNQYVIEASQHEQVHRASGSCIRRSDDVINPSADVIIAKFALFANPQLRCFPGCAVFDFQPELQSVSAAASKRCCSLHPGCSQSSNFRSSSFCCSSDATCRAAQWLECL